jgi:AAA domain-containing protein
MSDTAVPLSHQKLLSLGLLWPAEVDRICAEEESTQFLVDGLLPSKSVCIGAGDSTIGKSPWKYLLGLCVASGLPFAGHAVRQGRVVYFDLENSIQDSKRIRDALVGFLKLDGTPPEFFVRLEPPSDLEKFVSEIKPALVIVDSLRSFNPEASKDNTVAGKLLNELKRLARKYGVVFLIVHHLKKPQEKRGEDILHPTRLDNTSVVTWLLAMEGARALVNQTDVRIAMEAGDGNPVALKVKWNRRVHGDSSLVLFERVFDEHGVAIGYAHLVGVHLLSEEKQKAFAMLTDEFSFKQAMKALGKKAEMTSRFLRECIELGLIEKLPKGYRKVPQAGEAVRSAEYAE